MKSSHIGAAAAAAATVTVIAAPLAYADVTPNPASPGQSVTISDDKKCSGAAKATSTLFGDVVLTPGANHMVAEVKVPTGAKPGSYTVIVECGPGGAKATTSLTVSGMPTKPVRGGVGGTATEGNVTHVAAGAVLVAAAGAGAIYHVRRRGRRTAG